VIFRKPRDLSEAVSYRRYSPLKLFMAT